MEPMLMEPMAPCGLIMRAAAGGSDQAAGVGAGCANWLSQL
jgi:hypothetical protein